MVFATFLAAFFFATLLAAPVLVVLIAPIATGVPLMIVLIPPFVIAGVAVFAGFCEVVTRRVGLTAAIAMVFDGFVQAVVGLGDAPLAIRIVVSAAGGGTESGESREGGCR